MIFADKLILLRKKAGWSQEELADQMNVTRQSVSKWEGAQSVPDLEKMLRLSELFGVSTDYLLKDEIEEAEHIDLFDDTPLLRRVSMEEANAFLSVKLRTAKTIAYAAFLCIVSPIALLILSAISESTAGVLNENIANGIGMIVLIILVAIAAVMFISSGSKTAPFAYATYPYLICLSDYNRLLELSGKPALQLGEKEAAVYIDTEFTTVSRTAMLNQVLAGQPKVELDGSPIHLTGEVQSVNLVTDRSITLSFALILPDEAFLYYSQGMYDTYVNAVLSEQALDGNSLMTAYLDLNEKLDETGIEYESYLQNIGRQLFYTIASSYITLYLAIVFLVVANTIVGVQFLMSQQKTGRRYQTLIRLGATYETLCQSAGKQITWFMGLPVLVAAVSSLFGVRALFTGILSSRTRGTVSEMLLVSAAMILLLCVIEYIYMRVVKRSSDRYLLTLMQPQREE